MKFIGFLHILFVVALVVALGVANWNVFGWHAELGISDEQAAQLYQTNPNDPQITSWKEALQKEINLVKGACFEPFIVGGNAIPMGESLKNSCISIAGLVYDNCSSHPGVMLACLDPRISEWAGKANSTTPSNSNLTVTGPVSEPSTADNADLGCSDFDKKNFKVQPGDPYDLDPDGDGIACES